MRPDAFEILIDACEDISDDEKKCFKQIYEKIDVHGSTLRGKKIHVNWHLTDSTLLHIAALVKAGAEVTVSSIGGLVAHTDPIEALEKAGIPYFKSSEEIREKYPNSKDCDVYFDCGAKLLGILKPKHFGIELTHTNPKLYENIDYPIVNVDASITKLIETKFGTGQAYIEGLIHYVLKGNVKLPNLNIEALQRLSSKQKELEQSILIKQLIIKQNQLEALSQEYQRVSVDTLLASDDLIDLENQLAKLTLSVQSLVKKAEYNDANWKELHNKIIDEISQEQSFIPLDVDNTMPARLNKLNTILEKVVPKKISDQNKILQQQITVEKEQLQRIIDEQKNLIKVQLATNKKFVVFGYGKVGSGIVNALKSMGVLVKNVLVIEPGDYGCHAAKVNGVAHIKLSQENLARIREELKMANFVVSATGVEGAIGKWFTSEDFMCEKPKYCCNMSTDDDFGSSFPEEFFIANSRKIFNFILKYPTQVKFLEIIFGLAFISAENHMQRELIGKKLSNGLHKADINDDVEAFDLYEQKYKVQLVDKIDNKDLHLIPEKFLQLLIKLRESRNSGMQINPIRASRSANVVYSREFAPKNGGMDQSCQSEAYNNGYYSPQITGLRANGQTFKLKRAIENVNKTSAKIIKEDNQSVISKKVERQEMEVSPLQYSNVFHKSSKLEIIEIDELTNPQELTDPNVDVKQTLNPGALPPGPTIK